MQLLRRVVVTTTICLIANAAIADYASEVYRDEQIVINAGISGGSSPSVQFGDELTLTLEVAYDSASISIATLDEQFFSTAWPLTAGVLLRDWESRPGVARRDKFDEVRYQFRFQVIGCPDDQSTCPGDRSYAVPEFALPIETMGTQTNEIETKLLTFQPWPDTLTVTTKIVTDLDDQLYPFEKYFPTGGYPEPLQAPNKTRVSLVTAGIASILLIGAMLMWPFGGSGQKKAAAEVPRWKTSLQELREAETDDEVRYFDALRRCVVWYCNDELGVDPFVWLDLAEGDEAAESDSEHAELRAMFSELLLNPVGRSIELTERFEGLVADSGAVSA